MNRAPLIILFLLVMLSGLLAPVYAASEYGCFVCSAPAWLDQNTLVISRGLLHYGADHNGAFPEPPRYIYTVSHEGKNLRPVNLGASGAETSADGKTWLLSRGDLWTMQAQRLETLQMVWSVPAGHLLLESRFGTKDGYLALTRSLGQLHMWKLDRTGKVTGSARLGPAAGYSWAPSGRHLLMAGPAGLQWCTVEGALLTLLIPYKDFTMSPFGFPSRGNDQAYYRFNNQWFLAWPEAGVIKVQQAPAGFEPAPVYSPGPPAGGYLGPASVYHPAGSTQLLVGQENGLHLASLATGRGQPVSENIPQGRLSWNQAGDIAVFSSAGDMFYFRLRTAKAEPAGIGYDPVFSPKTDQVAYWRTHDGTPQIFLRDFPTGEQRALTRTGAKQPAWLSRDELACLVNDRTTWQPAILKVGAETPSIVASLSFHTIQLAAFPSYREARLFADQCEFFTGKYPVYIVSVDVNGVRWFRVRIGVFENIAQLDAALPVLREALKGVRSWDGVHMPARMNNEYGDIWPLPDGSGFIFDCMGLVYLYERTRNTLRILWRPDILQPRPVRQLSLSPDGTRLAFIDAQGNLTILRLDNGQIRTIVAARPF